MAIASIVAGVLLLAFGRRLFWLFVAIVGFLVGVNLAATLFPDNAMVGLLAGIALGGVAAVAAVFIQRLAVFLGGFLAGGYLAVTLLGMVFTTMGSNSWLPFVVGGILGALLMSVVFDWALIILSSLTGAILIARYLPLPGQFTAIVVVALFIIGMVTQASLHLRTR